MSNDDNKDKPINPFDFEAIRLPSDFEREAGVRKQLTLLRVRRPRKQEWVRVHPDPTYRAKVATVVYKESEDSRPEIYLVHPEVATDLGEDITYQTLYLAINRQGEPFVWPCRQPRMDGSAGDLAATSAIEAAEAAMGRSVRVQWRSPAYEISFRDDNIPEVAPRWPDKTFKELASVAFERPQLYIGSADHPVVKILQGRA
jgi:hypothetical protein